MATVDTADRDPRAVAQWAARLLRRAHATGPIHPAGSAAWTALDEADPRKPAAVVRAALAYLHESTPDVISARLHEELALLDRVTTDRLKAASADVSSAADWGRIAISSVPYAELHRRRYPWLYDPDWTNPLEVTAADRAAAAHWAATGHTYREDTAA